MLVFAGTSGVGNLACWFMQATHKPLTLPARRCRGGYRVTGPGRFGSPQPSSSTTSACPRVQVPSNACRRWLSDSSLAISPSVGASAWCQRGRLCSGGAQPLCRRCSQSPGPGLTTASSPLHRFAWIGGRGAPCAGVTYTVEVLAVSASGSASQSLAVFVGPRQAGVAPSAPGAAAGNRSGVGLSDENATKSAGATSPEEAGLIVVYSLSGVLLVVIVLAVVIHQYRKHRRRRKHRVIFVEEYEFEDTHLRVYPALGEPDTDTYMFSAAKASILQHAKLPVAVDRPAVDMDGRTADQPAAGQSHVSSARGSMARQQGAAPAWLDQAEHSQRPAWLAAAEDLSHRHSPRPPFSVERDFLAEAVVDASTDGGWLLQRAGPHFALRCCHLARGVYDAHYRCALHVTMQHV